MIIQVKQACEFTNKDGEVYRCPNGFIGIPPEWIASNDYFKAMCADGLILAHVDTSTIKEEPTKAEPKEESKGKKK